MRLLDLFCGAGGAAVGYARAGFEVVGVDNRQQKHYPFAFFLGDALEYLEKYGKEYDIIHASPPCQAYTQARYMVKAEMNYPDLIVRTREMLEATGKPYIIENVPGAPLKNAMVLCGSMFGLGVLRHRLFECLPALYWLPGGCDHSGGTLPMWWKRRQEVKAKGKECRYITVAGQSFLMDEAKKAMGINAQAIPPAYTEWVGKQMIGVM
jgi:DNA (cytosine-5)-methyltransferase 1